MLIDDVTIKVLAGKGGTGIVAFSKQKMRLGPAGGNGGKGGNIFIEGISNIAALNFFRNRKEFFAGDGKRAKGSCLDGATGEDLILKVPVGTVIHNLERKEIKDIIKIGERYLLARGGKGGKGNFSFRSSINTTPQEFTDGEMGEEKKVRLELKFIADIGIIGLPNAGKSSLLNILTRAKSKVANYNFTTLEPHLGVHYGLVLADIPGLIANASKGKGLGIKFLRHIERTRILFHLISSESEDFKKDYDIIRKEIETYSKDLASKKEYIVITKSDLLEKKKIAGFPHTLAISIYNDESIDKIKKTLEEINKEIRIY